MPIAITKMAFLNKYNDSGIIILEYHSKKKNKRGL